MKETSNLTIQIASEVKENKKCSITMKSEYVATIILEDYSGKKYINVGDRVKKGDLLFKMKYLNVIINYFSPCDIIIKKIYVAHNSILEYGTKIISMNVI